MKQRLSNNIYIYIIPTETSIWEARRGSNSISSGMIMIMIMISVRFLFRIGLRGGLLVWTFCLLLLFYALRACVCVLDKINTDGTTVEWFTRSRTLGGRFVGGRHVICIDIANMQRGTVRFRRFQLYLSVFEGNQSHFSH